MTSRGGMLEKVVFLDRDGVINRDSPNYIKRVAEFELLPRSLAAIRELTRSGYHVILITNQSVIGRGMVSEAGLARIHEHLKQTVAAGGGRIEDIFFCPHTPDDGCACRKPKPGLIRMAAQTYGIDVARTVMVGDSAKDIACARGAGCGAAVLVRTGNGRAAAKTLADHNMPVDYHADDLFDAVEWILRSRPPTQTPPSLPR